MCLFRSPRHMKKEICNGPYLQNPDAGFGIAVILFLTVIGRFFSNYGAGRQKERNEMKRSSATRQ